MLSTLAIIASLVLLMYFAYRGYTVLLLAPVMAALAVLLSGDAGYMLPVYTETFMKALGGYLLKFFPVFLLGALFGQLMADSGAAAAIAKGIVKLLGAKRAILAVVLACALLTYGGVSLFVVAFAIYPISTVLFREAGIPKRFIPAAIALGSFTFTMTALPGTPAIQNAIPIPYYQTNAFAAPILGVIGAVIMFGLGWWWIHHRAALAMAKGESYGTHEDDKASLADVNTHHMGFIPALLPLATVIAANALFTYIIFPQTDFSFLNDRYPDLNVSAQLGLWAIILALLAACVLLIIIQPKQWGSWKHSINKGVYGSMLPIFNTASEVGYGAVIASLAGFVLIRDWVLGVSPDNPLISETVAMTILAGITGSSSGGLSIALQTLGNDYLQMALAHNISPELLHRVAVMAAGGFDTLPHSGAVITLLSICHLSHKQSYAHIAMVTIMIPLLAVIAVIILGNMFGSF